MKLTKAKIDEAQAVLEAMASELGEDGFAVLPPCESRMNYAMSWFGHESWSIGKTLYDAYINALHAKAGTEPPPF